MKRAMDKLYRSDPARFRRLVVWVNTSRRKCSDEQIRDALLEFMDFERRNGAVDNWWTYLTKVLEKSVVRARIRAVEKHHADIKAEEAEWLRRLKSNPAAAIQLLSQSKKIN